MSTANNALLSNLGITGFPLGEDDIFLPNITTQAGAYPVRSGVVRVTRASASSSMILKHVQSGDAAPLTFVVNDSAQTIAVFCGAGDNLNGSANGSLSIPTGQSGMFVRVPNSISASGQGWRAVAIP